MSKQKDSHKEYLEIYKQRYETFRHLDKLFWQMLQIAAAATSVVLAFGNKDLNNPEWWIIIAVGAILTVLGIAMLKIDHGKRGNGRVLNWVGNKIGDTKIPGQRSKWCSASYWTALSVTGLGLACLISLLFI